MVALMKSRQRALSNEISDLYKRVNETSKVPANMLVPEEKAAMEKVPANNRVLDTYFSQRVRRVPGTTMHPTMVTELFNFVDGKRSYFDIYKALKAEAMAAGSWYYGKVKLEDVIAILDANVASGSMELK
jgi:hypothetical protein